MRQTRTEQPRTRESRPAHSDGAASGLRHIRDEVPVRTGLVERGRHPQEIRAQHPGLRPVEGRRARRHREVVHGCHALPEPDKHVQAPSRGPAQGGQGSPELRPRPQEQPVALRETRLHHAPGPGRHQADLHARRDHGARMQGDPRQPLHGHHGTDCERALPGIRHDFNHSLIAARTV